MLIKKKLVLMVFVLLMLLLVSGDVSAEPDLPDLEISTQKILVSPSKRTHVNQFGWQSQIIEPYSKEFSLSPRSQQAGDLRQGVAAPDSPAAVVNLKLNAELAQGGSVDGFQISPDGNWAIYRAEQDIPRDGYVPQFTYGLYSVPLSGGSPVQLNVPLPYPRAEVRGFAISPDSSFVVYRLDMDVTDLDAQDELYSVPIEGGDSVQLTPRSVMENYAISLDGNRVVYVSDFKLFSVPIEGGTPLKLNGPLVEGGIVDEFVISPDSSRVVYRSDQDADDVFELYSVPIEDGMPTKLNGQLVSGGAIAADFVTSPDGTRVIYRADQEVDDVFELYSVPIKGGTPLKLNGQLVSGGDVAWSGFEVTPDSLRVVYRADQDADEATELYSVPIEGGTPVKLNEPLVAGGYILSFDLTDDGSRVVYYGDQDTNDLEQLYSVPPEGGTPVNLNEEGGHPEYDYVISPASDWVVYASGESLHSVPIDGGTPIQLKSGTTTLWSGFRVSPDGAHVVFQQFLESKQLYRVPITGGTLVRLNGPLVMNGEVDPYDFEITPNSSQVVYLAEQEEYDLHELYRVPITGGDTTKLSERDATYGDVSNDLVSPDGQRVVYRADGDVDNVWELYSVPSTGDTPVKLNGPPSEFGEVADERISISPDSNWVIYLAGNEALNLYSVPIKGGTPVKLNGDLVAGGEIDALSIEISPDSQYVVYLADQDEDDIWELYSVTIEGGTPVKLNGDLGGSGDVEDDFAISPDSSRVVYRADQDTNGVRELYSAPISGGSFAKLSGSMPSDGDVANFRFSPDSQYVLYTADQETDGLRELYSVSLTGGTPVKLNGSVDGNMYFSSISVSLDSQWVVFVAHYEAVSGHHLYTVPIDGGTPIMLSEERSYPVRVRGDFLITPDSSRVVYRADQETEDDDELYSVPITGGTPTKLNGPINSIAGDVKSGFQLTSDGSRVLYRADLEETAMYDLYSVSVEGGDAIRLNYTPNGHWNVYCFDISPDNQWVVWGCSSHDLYSVPVTGGMPTWLMEASSNGHWEISPDSSRVAWMAEFTLPGWVELFAVSITGGSLFQLNVPLDPLLGNVTGFEFLPDGSGVIYRADQHDTVDELFASLFVPGADLGIQKNVESATSVAAGQPLTYQLTISNTGELAASGVIISDTIPSELTDLSFDYGGIELTQIGSTPYRWQVQDLAPGEGGVITITGILDPALSDGVDIINTATISSETPDDNYGDNEAQVNVRVKSGLQNYLPYLAKDE